MKEPTKTAQPEKTAHHRKPGRERPSFDEYSMHFAMTARRRANCVGSLVGAVLMKDNRVISTGYNGTPSDMPNCDDGGCHRCAERERYPRGTAYDICVCVHAEQNALLNAARFGHAVDGTMCFVTMQPCFGCSKELLQAGVIGVRYLTKWEPADQELSEEYRRLQTKFSKGVKQLKMKDPDAAKALTPRAQPEETGHSIPREGG